MKNIFQTQRIENDNWQWQLAMTEAQGRDQAVIMGLFTIHSFSWNMDNLSLQIKGKLHLIVLFKIIEKTDFSLLATK